MTTDLPNFPCFGILLVTHAPLGDAMLKCAAHVLGRLPAHVVAIDIVADADPEALQRQLCEVTQTLNQGRGVLILTDLFGSTPANIASKLAQNPENTVLAGVNLAMLLRAITYRNAPLDIAIEKIVQGARHAILNVCAGTDGHASSITSRT